MVKARQRFRTPNENEKAIATEHAQTVTNLKERRSNKENTKSSKSYYSCKYKK
jgi:hypothetical protein